MPLFAPPAAPVGLATTTTAGTVIVPVSGNLTVDGSGNISLPSLDATKITTGTLPLARLSGITTSQLSASAALVAGQIASVNPSTLTGSGTVPLAALSGITTTQLDAAAAITSAQIAALDATKITTGTLPLARLSGITTSQLAAGAAITSGQIASVAASTITGTNTLPDGVLSTNVPLLNAANTFTALQTIAASIAGPLAQVNNSSTTGAGVVVGSTTVASAGAGKIAPALALTQAPPATANYGLLSIGNGAWDGSSAGKYAGSANGSGVAINMASGYTGRLLEGQVAGVSQVFVGATGNMTIAGTLTAGTGVTVSTGSLSVGTIQQVGSQIVVRMTANQSGTTGIFQLSADSFASPTVGMNASSGTQSWLNVAAVANQSGTAAYTGLLVNVTELATGSGTKNLLDLQFGGTSKASFDKTGALAFTPATTTTAPSAGAGGALPATPAGYATVTIAGTARQLAYY